MALSNKDINKISGIVEKKVSSLDTKITKEFGFLRLEMNQRFDATDKKIDNNHQEILDKIEEIKKWKMKIFKRWLSISEKSKRKSPFDKIQFEPL